MIRNRKLHLLAATFGALSACTLDEDATRIDAQRGQALFAANCAQCHGADAGGAGPESLGLGAPPPSLRQLSINNDGIFPRDYVMDTIGGLTFHNMRTAAMPDFSTCNLGPAVQIDRDGRMVAIPAGVVALTNYLETLQD